MASLVSAQSALDAGSWQLARSEFLAVAEESADPRAFEGLAQVAWWLDDGEVCVGARETAYRRHRECAELVRLAVERDELRDRLSEIESAIVAQVVRERRAGASWGDVGRVLGMTRQGARQRFGHE